MENYNYPIGFWNCVSATKFGLKVVKDWEDIGATLTMTGFYDIAEEKEEMLAILDECQKKNIKVIFNDRSIIFKNYRKDWYKERLKQRIADFGSHPAIYAFK